MKVLENSNTALRNELELLRKMSSNKKVKQSYTRCSSKIGTSNYLTRLHCIESTSYSGYLNIHLLESFNLIETSIFNTIFGWPYFFK